MANYPISKEFGIFRHFSPPISPGFLRLAAKHMKPPRALWKARDLTVETRQVTSFDGAPFEVLVLTPKDAEGKLPCLIYLHGGGFVLEAAGYHYELAMRYAREVRCKVVFVQYRIAPEVCHPVFFEDCYAAFSWAYDSAEALNIDRQRIGIGGDSAGSTLAVGVCMMARERNHPGRFCFQMLPYPYLDARGTSDSAKKYTDTPMWNSTLSSRVGNITKADRSNPNFVWYSPVEAERFDGLPPAYIETAEFDCLHDDGILYDKLLTHAGIQTELNETKGTMHGYDIVLNASITKASIARRIAFMKRHFYK